jgi:hypothetical protein
MNELLEALKTLSVRELHVSPFDLSVDFMAPWPGYEGVIVTLDAKTPQELTQAILRMPGGADNV